MKYLVTGITGAGKTSVSNELRKLGFTAYDGDKRTGLGRWVDGNDKPVRVPARLTRDWIERHHWNWDESHIKRLLSQHQTVFICGSSSNVDKFYSCFDKVYLLSVSQQTMKNRLNARSYGFGKFKQEQQLALAWHEWFEKHHRNLGATIIDANQPLKSVIDDLLKQL